MTIDVSGGSRAQADHSDAAQAVSARRRYNRLGAWATVTRTALAVASWAGLLVSAISEYGFDVDFPLTPPLWLAIAVCVWLISSAHITAAAPTDRVAEPASRARWRSDAPSLIDPGTRLLISDKSTDSQPSNRSKGRLEHRALQVKRGFEDSPQDCPNIPATGVTPLNLTSEAVTVPRTIQSVVFPDSTAARGPPRVMRESPQLFACPLGRPTRPYYFASLPLKFNVSDSLPIRAGFPSRFGQTPIRSAIDGEQA